MRRRTVRVGVFAHNEEATLETAVRAILDQDLELAAATLTEVVIVSCGSVDRTDAIASSLARVDPRVRVLASLRREGKARAINRFLASGDADLIVLVSGDVVLERGALVELLLPFHDPRVGMTGGRPVPQNELRGIGRLVHLLWQLHDRVARRSPKLGEAIALRAPVQPIPEWTSADEASLEAQITQGRGLSLAYRPRAVLHNHGPTTLSDYLEHRRRVARAHSEVEAAGYRPATRELRVVLRHAVAHALGRPSDVGWLCAAAAIEAWAWVAGAIDARSAVAPRGTWTRLESAKRPVARPDLAPMPPP